MADLPARIDGLGPAIEKLMGIGGTPGLSLGVISQGEPIYYRGYGSRDTEKDLPITKETITPVGSLTKALTAAALAILVDEKKATWDTLVKDALPSFQSRDSTLQNCLTLTDILCHRGGMSWGDNLVIGTENNILIGSRDAMKYINNQTLLLPFRAQFAYSNVAYDLAGQVIEALSGMPYSDFVESRILRPLSMERSFLKTPPSHLDNVSKCYNALDDASTVSITCSQAGNDVYMGPTAGLRSCVGDLMKLYTAFVTSFTSQHETGKAATDGSPFKQVAELMSAKIPMDQPSRNEVSYGLGWGRVQLPGKMGQIGLNPGLLPSGMPTIGNGVPPELVIFHQGSMPGVLSIVILLPSTNSAIIVLSNSLALTDVADWVGQLVLEEVLSVPQSHRVDFTKFAEETVTENLKWYPSVTKELEEARVNGTSPRDLHEYVGTYWDDIHVFKIVVTAENGVLYWALQGLETEKFQLRHYEYDTFTWLQPRNELSRRGRWVGADQGPSFWKVEFKAGEKGEVKSLFWEHDSGVAPVEYKK